MNPIARRTRRHSATRALCLAGAALPPASHAIVFAIGNSSIDVRAWADAERIRHGVDAFLLTALLTVAFAPIAGVAISTSDSGSQLPTGIERRAFRAATRMTMHLGAVLVTTLIVSAALTFISMRTLPAIAQMMTMSHTTLGLGALALGLFGAWAGVRCSHPLDAAGLGIATALILTLGVLVAGPLVAELPVRLIDAALLASPLVAASAAAGIDLFRIEFLYQLSPLASLGFDYPSWRAASMAYALVALACFSGMSRAIGKRPTLHRN